MKIKLTIVFILTFSIQIQYVMGQKIDTKEYNNISIDLREKSTIIFKGTFFTGRGPSQIYAEGKSRWRLIKGFKIDEDLIGNIRIKEIEIYPILKIDSLSSNIIETNLINGKQYYVLLNPGTEILKYITDDITTFNHYDHKISQEEIIAIINIE